MKLSLTYKSVFGRDSYYPACDTSRTLCEVCGCKTLTTHQLEVMKGAGWEIDVSGYVPA